MFCSLLGMRVLLVEDDYLQANELANALENHGCDVIGPYATLGSGVLAFDTAAIDAAVLDVRLGRDRVYYLADKLKAAQIPFIFLTGYDPDLIPGRFDNIACLVKSVEFEEVAATIATLIGVHARRH